MGPKFTSLVCFAMGSLCLGQSAPPNAAKLTLETLPQTNVKFEAVGDGLAVSPKSLFIGYPFCSTNGTVFANALLPPSFSVTSFIGISPVGEVHQYSFENLPGLVNTHIASVDADGSDVYALVSAQKADILREHDLDPGDSAVKTETRYYQHFVVHVAPDQTPPKLIALDLSFHPSRVAVLDSDTLVIVGVDAGNEQPVLAIVDDSGKILREPDPRDIFGTVGEMAAGLPQELKSQVAGLSVPGQLSAELSTMQFVHYRNSLLLLVPGTKSRLITIRSNGEISSTKLRLPEGFSPRSLISSDNNWFIRASGGSGDQETVLLMVDPSSGDALKVIRPQLLTPLDITCVHDGSFLGIHWGGDNSDQKLRLMRGRE